MKNRTHMKSISRGGSTLCVSLVLIAAITTSVGIIGGTALHNSRKATRLANQTRAQAIAEAGARYAYSVLSTNYALASLTAPFPVTTFDGGTYSVRVLSSNSNVASIACMGVYRDARREVAVDIGNADLSADASERFPLSEAFKCNIVAERTITWTGTAIFGGNTGRVHANGAFKQSGSGCLNADVYSCESVTLKGAAGYIDGEVFAPSVVGKTEKIYDTIHRGTVPKLTLPALDLTPYYYNALANGEVYHSKVNLTTAYQPRGGVMWVEGDLVLAASQDSVGCFIATGDISCTGSGGVQNVDDYPGMISKHGSINLGGSGTYHGLIYALIGDVTFSGGGALDGVIFCGRDFVKTGGQTTFLFDAALGIPGTDPSAYRDEMVYLRAWQK